MRTSIVRVPRPDAIRGSSSNWPPASLCSSAPIKLSTATAAPPRVCRSTRIAQPSLMPSRDTSSRTETLRRPRSSSTHLKIGSQRSKLDGGRLPSVTSWLSVDGGGDGGGAGGRGSHEPKFSNGCDEVVICRSNRAATVTVAQSKASFGAARCLIAVRRGG